MTSSRSRLGAGASNDSGTLGRVGAGYWSAPSAGSVLGRVLSTGLLLVLSACAGGQSNAESAADCAEGEPHAAPGFAPPGQTKSLPRYFTLELSGTEALVDGKPLRGHDLSVRIDGEARNPENGGAMIRLAPDFSGEVLGAIVWELSTAGFAHIIVWKAEPGAASEPPETPAELIAPGAESAPPVKVEQAEASPPASAPPAAERVDAAPDASVRTIGLHVGGGPNDDETRGRFIAPIEKQFDALLRCHALAGKRDRNASVGVDLLIPAGGGRAALKDLRTALSGEEFKSCVKGVLEKVEFPRVSRATMVSYSMLFEPTAQR